MKTKGKKSKTPKKNSELVNNFIFSLYGKSENTQKMYACLLKKFASKTVRIDRLTIEHIEQYILTLQKKYKPSSVNLTINVIKSFYNYLAENGYQNTGRFLKTIPALPPEQRILTKDEYNRVCKRVKETYKLDCFKFLCNTGLRVSEFVSLRRENVTKGFLRVIGKGRRNRSVPMNNVVKEIYSRNRNFEMIHHYFRGKPFKNASIILHENRQWVFRLCKQIAKEARIATFHPHSCRHYFANELYHRGVDMYTISRLLGHSSTSTTENVYVHWSEESLVGATNILES